MIKKIKYSYISLIDKEIIEKQINGKIKKIFGISSFSKTNTPEVVVMSPVIKGNPFPTLFWLTSPKLKVAISHLERDGLIKYLENSSDDDFIKSLHNNHENYQKLRISLYENTFGKGFLSLDKEKIIYSTGIGGIRDFKTIKCLHLHYAYFLSGYDSIIGKIVHYHLFNE